MSAITAYAFSFDGLQGEPIRLMIDLPNDADIVTLLPYREGQKLLLVSSDGRGFVAAQDEAAAQTRAGKQVMNPAEGAVARWCFPLGGTEGFDAVGLLGDNRKLLVLPVEEIPEMQRGRGVILQDDAVVADLDQVAVLQVLRMRDAKAVDEDAVIASQVL